MLALPNPYDIDPTSRVSAYRVRSAHIKRQRRISKISTGIYIEGLLQNTFLQQAHFYRLAI